MKSSFKKRNKKNQSKDPQEQGQENVLKYSVGKEWL
jgi:hypothetical protein